MLDRTRSRAVCCGRGVARRADASGGTRLRRRRTDPRPAAGLQDNSFLIEEAYNQEAGVVQHVGSLPPAEPRLGVSPSTEEWPIRSQTHQFSYTRALSLAAQRGHAAASAISNSSYRYPGAQRDRDPAGIRSAIHASSCRPATTARGPAFDSYGYQINLPVSKIIADRVTHSRQRGPHLLFRRVRPAADELQPRRQHHLRGDARDQRAGRGARRVDRDRGSSMRAASSANSPSRCSPACRHAFNLEQGSQLVLGAGMPIQFTGRATRMSERWCSFPSSTSSR